MKRIVPLLLAALLLLPVSCRKNGGPALTGFWHMDRAKVTFSFGSGTSVSKEFNGSELASLLGQLGGDASALLDDEIALHLAEAGLDVGLLEDGTADLAVSVTTDSGLTVSERRKGTYLRDGNTLTLTLEEWTVPAEILQLTNAELVLRVILPEGFVSESMPAQLDLYFVR